MMAFLIRIGLLRARRLVDLPLDKRLLAVGIAHASPNPISIIRSARHV